MVYFIECYMSAINGLIYIVFINVACLRMYIIKYQIDLANILTYSAVLVLEINTVYKTFPISVLTVVVFNFSIFTIAHIPRLKIKNFN